jgi:hypothetical protein
LGLVVQGNLARLDRLVVIQLFLQLHLMVAAAVGVMVALLMVLMVVQVVVLHNLAVLLELPVTATHHLHLQAKVIMVELAA